MSHEVSEGVYAVDMDVMVKIVEPFTEWIPWDCEDFTIDDVINVPLGAESNVVYNPQYDYMLDDPTAYHIARIAYLARYPEVMDSDDYAVFCPSYYNTGGHPLLDGNHRYAAALVRGDKFFMVTVDGDIDEAEEIFQISRSKVGA